MAVTALLLKGLYVVCDLQIVYSKRTKKLQLILASLESMNTFMVYPQLNQAICTSHFISVHVLVVNTTDGKFTGG